MNAWISTTESLPEGGVDVLIFDGKNVMVAHREVVTGLPGGWYWSAPRWVVGYDAWIDIEDCEDNVPAPVTHWMLLPANPS